MASGSYKSALLLLTLLLSQSWRTTAETALGNVALGNLLDRDNSLGYQFYEQFSNLTTTTAAMEPACAAQLALVLAGLQQQQLWALKFVDAWGKLPAGLLYGNLMEMGNFEECLSISVQLSQPAAQQLSGKYCLASVPLAGNADQMNAQTLNMGVCMPAACSAAELDPLLKQLLHNTLNVSLDVAASWLPAESACSVQQRAPFSALDWVAIGILILLAVLLTLSTIADYYASSQETGTLHPLLMSFSVRSNMRYLFHISSHSSSPNVIPCLHGIRCMSLIWIVFGHGYMMLLLSPNVNAVEILMWAQTPFSMFRQTGIVISVDSFFFLSGLLLGLMALKEMDKTSGSLNVPLMYMHRFLRLMPVLALSVLLFMSLYRYTGSGPIWHNFTRSYELCEETWWATLLYVQNYAAAGKMCLGHSWYLAVDTQLFVLSPLILIPIWKWKRKGLAAVFVLGLLLFACLFSIIIIDELSFTNIIKNLGGDRPEMRKIYYSTHTRTSPWLIGIMFAYFLHNRNGRRLNLSKLTVMLGWLASLGLLFTVIFSLYPSVQLDAAPLTSLESAFYVSLSRIAWPLALCWIVLACMNGYGGPANHFLSWSLWQPVSKLSYSMYIWHLLVLIANAARIKTNTHFSDYDVILRFWGDWGITLMVSIVLFLSVEAPTVAIEKFLRTNSRKEKQAPVPGSQQNLCD